jgi:hypothetical protein
MVDHFGTGCFAGHLHVVRSALWGIWHEIMLYLA